MTEYDRWGESGPGKPDGSFKGQLFSAYGQADEEQRLVLDLAFPELFTYGGEDPVEEAEAIELARLEDLFNGKIQEDSVLNKLKQQREARVKAICERFLTTEAADMPDVFTEYIIDTLTCVQEDEGLDADETIILRYFDLLFNGEN